MKHVRLPKYIKPERYQLTIKPDLKNFTFEGDEVIFLNLKKAVTEITLHSKELDIASSIYVSTSPALRASSPRQERRGSTNYDPKSETATFKFAKALPKGKGELRLKFSGILNDKMRGFYRSRYMHEGKEKHMATTQFEATDARRAFPCFDEPSSKAVFDVTLMVPKGLTAISNTVESSVVEHKSGYRVVKFAPTPKMSTYLLAFIVGDFEFIEGRTKSQRKVSVGNGFKPFPTSQTDKGTLVRVFVTPGKKHQAKFALDTAIKVLEFYNEYFDIPYPLPVLDLIAIPDFSHGAMENWGAVTYRESALLVDPENSSAANKQWVALVIAHELAHQWFGNLVTMEWWTHLWLNEGFASYIEYLATNKLFPSWDIWTQFAYADLGVALKLDALKNTHPIEVEVGHPDEIGEIFDEISYSKGASIIRMLAGYLGEKDFRDGLRYYLKKHSYSNASTVDLWKALEKVSGKPVEKLMKNWTSRPGYPVVKIVEGLKNFKLTQERFFSSSISKKKSTELTVWDIPIGIGMPQTAQAGKFLLKSKSATIGKTKSDWTKLNVGETGFFRVDYPAQMLAALRQPVKEKNISPIDRLGLVRDAFALAEAGQLPTVQALELAEAYVNETDYTVWVELVSGLAGVKNLIYGSDFYVNFEQFAQKLLSPIGKAVGFYPKKGEKHTYGLLRSLILGQLTAFNHQSTIELGLKIFESGKIPPDIRSLIYQIVAQTGNAKQHANFVARYKSEQLNEEQNRIGRALGQFKDAGLLKKTLEFAMSKDVRIQDTAQIFSSVWANQEGRNLAWQFTKTHWAELLKKYPGSGHILNRFIKPAAGFVTMEKATEVNLFFKKHQAPGAKRAIEQTLEKIYSNAAWLNRDETHIKNWLSKKLTF